jgi:hypothetical protein
MSMKKKMAHMFESVAQEKKEGPKHEKAESKAKEKGEHGGKKKLILRATKKGK